MTGLDRAFEDHRQLIWGLCYRMTGVAQEADELVQDTFVRAIERPPADTGRPWRPWLVRVATNLARDHLRRRSRQAYPGIWLPSPVQTGDEDPIEWLARLDPLAMDEPGPDARYELMESVSFAFLVALEALSPTQRAVLVLRDVLGFSGRETADALELSLPNVKTTLHRARKAMQAYDTSRTQPDQEGIEVVARFAAALLARDAEAVRQLLADDAEARSDGGGVFVSAGVPILGADRITRFYLGIFKSSTFPDRSALLTVNGLPAIVSEWDDRGDGRYAPRSVVAFEVAAGQIRRMWTVMAPTKLA